MAPVTAFLVSPTSSYFASSTSARTSVERRCVASLTSSPTHWSPRAVSSSGVRGMYGTAPTTSGSLRWCLGLLTGVIVPCVGFGGSTDSLEHRSFFDDAAARGLRAVLGPIGEFQVKVQEVRAESGVPDR